MYSLDLFLPSNCSQTTMIRMGSTLREMPCVALTQLLTVTEVLRCSQLVPLVWLAAQVS
jgi:hypothetical protein